MVGRTGPAVGTAGSEGRIGALAGGSATLGVLTGILTRLARLTILPEPAWLSVLSEETLLRTGAIPLVRLLVGLLLTLIVGRRTRACWRVGSILGRRPIVRLLLRRRILPCGRATGSGGWSPGAAIAIRPVFRGRGPCIATRHGNRGRGPLIPGLSLLVPFFWHGDLSRVGLVCGSSRLLLLIGGPALDVAWLPGLTVIAAPPRVGLVLFSHFCSFGSMPLPAIRSRLSIYPVARAFCCFRLTGEAGPRMHCFQV